VSLFGGFVVDVVVVVVVVVVIIDGTT